MQMFTRTVLHPGNSSFAKIRLDLGEYRDYRLDLLALLLILRFFQPRLSHFERVFAVLLETSYISVMLVWAHFAVMWQDHAHNTAEERVMVVCFFNVV
jgi:hypothetical protein